MPIRNALRETVDPGDLMLTHGLGHQEQERRPAAWPMDGDMALLVCGPARLPAYGNGSGIVDGDWDDLFNAVQDKLVHAVSRTDLDAAVSSERRAAQVRDCVLDCVSALRILQDTVTGERLRRDGLALAVFDAQTSLAQVRAALVGTKRGERQARHDASHDSLTLLPNREFLIQCIDRQLARAAKIRRMFAVMFVDLDGFKLVNDTHGHAVGDELLRVVAARLRRVIRAQDVVGRVGGDEFACMIDGVDDRAQLTHLADKIGQAISAPCTVGGLNLAVHASIGIATWPDEAANADALLKNAGLAMVAAKRQHVRHAFFSRDDAGTTAA